jgi:hypothetical protein
MTTDIIQDMGENPNATPMVVKRKLAPERRKKKDVKYRKAPQAPKRFKSAYMFFSTAMHPAIRKRLGKKGVTEKVRSLHYILTNDVNGEQAIIEPPS